MTYKLRRKSSMLISSATACQVTKFYYGTSCVLSLSLSLSLSHMYLRLNFRTDTSYLLECYGIELWYITIKSHHLWPKLGLSAFP